MSQPTKAFKVYQASAGSGKTYTIVKEYLELCLKSEGAVSNYNHILAITFTNMAANDMKAKILKHLSDIINSDPGKAPENMEKTLLQDLGISREALKKNAGLLFQNIIHDYSSFCVSTIDAFFQRLARSFAKELGLPTQFNTSLDEDEVAEAITARIGEQIGPSNPFLTKILEDFYEYRFDNEKNPKIAVNIHEFIKQLFAEDAFLKNEKNLFTSEADYKTTLEFIQRKTAISKANLEQSANAFLEALDTFIQKYSLTVDSFYYKASNPCLKLQSKLKQKDYPPLNDTQLKLLIGDYKWYSKDLEKRLGPAMDAANEEFMATVVKPMEDYHRKLGVNNYYLEQRAQLCLYVLRSIIKAEMEAYVGEEQLVPISEFNKRINDVLGDFTVPFVYERLGERFRHLFIDEFQDTSVLQWQNLIPLLDNGLANQNMNMVVGDGKQSIYRWRNGEVGQIVSLPRIYQKPADSPAFDFFEQNLFNNFNFNRLDRNFRSFKTIVDFNNAFFKFCAENYLSEECRKVYLEKDSQLNKEVSIHQEANINKTGLVQFELFDAKTADDTVLSRIKTIIEELLAHGFEKKDITILVRTNDKGALVANYLNEQGIDITSAESLLLRSSDRVQLIINTLDYLIHTDNILDIAAVLYYWNVTHNKINNGNVDGIFEAAKPITEGKKSLEECLELAPGTLKALLDNSFSLYDLCAALARNYGFNSLEDSYLSFLLDAVFKWQSSGESGIEAFLEYWEKKSEHLSIQPGSTDAVSIMTIHKSKGLEFPVVIYPFVNDNLSDSKSNTLWVAPETLGFEKIPNIDKVQFKITENNKQWSAQTQKIAAEDKEKTKLDNLNLHYVAFTRAEQRLYTLSYRRKKDEGNSPILSFLKDEHKVEELSGEGHDVYQFGDPSTVKLNLKKEESDLPKAFFNESKAGEWFEKINIDPNPSMFWISPENHMQPREWGEFVHQLLSQILSPEDIDRTLKPFLDEGTINENVVMHLKDLFEKMVGHPLLREAFSPKAKVKNECELFSVKYGIRRPDRFAELPDKIYLLDYKTGDKSDKHHVQLLEYVSILKTIIDKKIETYLVYLGKSVEVVPVTAKQLSINF